MRLIGYSIGAATLLILLKAQGRSLAIPGGRNWLHVVAAALFLAVGFGVAGTFAQLMANTSRVIIVNYSMPVWGSLMAYFVLRERINRVRDRPGAVRRRPSVLVYPVRGTSLREPIGLLLAFVLRALLGRRHRLHEMGAHQGRPAGDHVLAGDGRRRGVRRFYLVFEGVPKCEPLQWRTWGGLLFNGMLGTGIAYFIWFNIIGRLSTAMASLGSLINPVVGVIGAVIILGDRPTRAGHDRLRADLQRRRLRADPAAKQDPGSARPRPGVGERAVKKTKARRRSVGLRHRAEARGS